MCAQEGLPSTDRNRQVTFPPDRRRVNNFRYLLLRVALSGLAAALALSHEPTVAEDVPREIDRGQDFAVYRTITTSTNTEGTVVYRTNEFTLLENAVNYFEDGAWKESEDVIEPFPDGAVARRGPHKAIFSHELNTEAVFDIEAADGGRLRGGVRSIELTDVATGASVELATVKESVTGQLLPPNQILYPNAFNGLEADVLLIWKHNYFGHEVLLRERPQLPEGWDQATVRLEIVTEFVVDAQPELRVNTLRLPGLPELSDHAVIHFGSLAILPGKAFPLAGDAALILGSLSPEHPGAAVLKQWHVTGDGRSFLVESVAWSDVAADLDGLPAAQAAANHREGIGDVELAHAWPPTPAAVKRREPLQVALTPFKPVGYAIDFFIIPDQGQPTVLATGTTYYIKTSYYSGTGVTFQPGCVVKYKNNANMVLYGYINFPDTLQTPVLTSRNDDGFGEVIKGVLGESDSNGDPSLHKAAQAIWIYYVTFNTEVRSARIRWAKKGIQYDQNAGVTASHIVRNCLFEQITGTGSAGISINIPSGSGVSLINVEKCDVTTPVSGGTYSGSMVNALFCTEKNFLAAQSTNTALTLVNPPDTMGAVGPNHFVMVVNQAVAVFDKSTGSRLESATAANFFGGSSNPNMTDPAIRYDHLCGRWVATMLDSGGIVRIAISHSSNPLGLIANWNRFNKSVAEPDYSPDLPTLGLDANGIYIAVRLTKGNPFNPTHWMYKVIAIKKPASCGTITQSHIKNPIPLNNNTGYKVLWVQPAVNLNSTASYAWFLAKGDPASGSPIVYNRLQWLAGDTPAFVGGPTLSQSVTFPEPYPYYDLDNNQSFAVPQKPVTGGGTTPNALTGSRLQMAVIRSNFLWTCQHLGLDGGDATYGGGTVDRTACGWYKMKIKTDNTLSLNRTVDGADYGRIYDTAASTPYFYYYPSVGVNAPGEMVIGFSGSRSTEFIGAFYSGRRSSGLVPARPVLVQAGRDYFNYIRWGDYTYTSVDPIDGKLWTIQQAGDLRTDPLGDPDDHYVLWIAKVKINP